MKTPNLHVIMALIKDGIKVYKAKEIKRMSAAELTNVEKYYTTLLEAMYGTDIWKAIDTLKMVQELLSRPQLTLEQKEFMEEIQKNYGRK